MIIECCSQERSYSQFYGLIGERFCKLNRVWTENFQEAFQKYYDTIHRYETNKLRNIGRFFGHLLASDGISWAVLHVVHMNEEETTSSSRIFVKILMQEMIEEMGIAKMVERFRIPDMRPAFAGMFPTDNPKNTRFAINYFTSIGMGKVTEDMRTWLQNAPKMLAAQHAALKAAESSSDSDSSSDISSSELSSSSDSDSDSDSDGGRSRRRPRRSPSDSRSPPPRRRRKYTSESRSPSPPPRRRSPPPKRRYSDSASPPPRRRESPPPAARRASPPRRVRRYSDDSPPPRRAPLPVGRDERSPPRRVPSPRDRDRSPPPRRRRYDDSPSRSPPRRRRDSSTPPRRR
jgi:pre-mRNA-splicing factor CWC22